MKRFIVIFCLFFISSSYGEYRDPRWFNRQTRTVTKYLKTQQVITEATPSSCVVVQTSLPPCRHLRGLNIKPSGATRIVPTNAPNLPTSGSEQSWKPIMQPSDPIPPSRTPPLPMKEQPKPIVDSSSGGWDWDIFNLGPKDVTVTKTVHEVFTTKYYDPNTVVTFSVKGCRPSRLPFDLPECKLTETEVHDPIPERNVIVMAPVQFVPSLDHVLSPAKSEIPPPKIPEENLKKETEGVKMP